MILFGDGPDHFTGISCRHYAGRDIFCHHRSGTDDYIVSNSNSRVDHSIPSYPHVAADPDLLSILQLSIPNLGIYGMSCGINRDPRTEKYIVIRISISQTSRIMQS